MSFFNEKIVICHANELFLMETFIACENTEALFAIILFGLIYTDFCNY